MLVMITMCDGSVLGMVWCGSSFGYLRAGGGDDGDGGDGDGDGSVDGGDDGDGSGDGNDSKVSMLC